MPNSNAALDVTSHASLSMLESAVARLGRRAREEGVALPGLIPQWHGAKRITGYAVPVTLCTDEGFPFGRRENLEWWRYLEAQPEPRVIVAQVLSREQGSGAACGVLSAHIYRSIGCHGFITDGYVRDVEQIEKSGLLLAARGATLRHGVPHVVKFGQPVHVFGMQVSAKDVVAAGEEGALTFPASWLPEIPSKIREVAASVNKMIRFCHNPHTAGDIAAAQAQAMPANSGTTAQNGTAAR